MNYDAAATLLAELDPAEAEKVLAGLADAFLTRPGFDPLSADALPDPPDPHLQARYRTLVEQIPAVVFMVYLDRGMGEAYVSPQIEAILGFTREEWLEDPIRWYSSIHPDDKFRWSAEAAQLFLSGEPLHSVYRIISRDQRVVWFHCDARMVRRQDGRPCFIHGVAFDISDLKRTEAALQEERNFASAVLDTVGALVLVLDAQGRIVRFNRACERTTGYAATEVIGGRAADLFLTPEDAPRFREIFEQFRAGRLTAAAYESSWATRQGTRRAIAWSSTVLANARGGLEYVILTGIDVTESNRLERTILEISGREQRRIGQDLHDGLGQHLTGVAFMSKVLQQKLRDKALPEAHDAAKIVSLVNEAINKTRELSRGLLPVFSEARGLMSALERLAIEVEDVFQISCRFECEQPVLVRQTGIATHLYHIAQEAVNNAMKHGHCQHIVINLTGGEEWRLTVYDDGVGIPESRPGTSPQGMGLLIMGYRAKMIGGTLEVRPGRNGGTSVCCAFPASSLEWEEI
ncbi:MAG TPA: PAS domain S-box protein [Bryobacteraceae bacterium]|nr:PAS domain S-box protein [Bryobacteraceae bacterium]